MLTTEEILAAEEEWTQAHLDTDVETIDRLMHPDYTIIKPGGEIWVKENDGLRIVSDQSTEVK
jgi:hypothetical protein